MRLVLLCLLALPAPAADPPAVPKAPLVVALPGPNRAAEPGAAAKVPVGTFRFVTLKDHAGPVTWDVTGTAVKVGEVKAAGEVWGRHADGPAEPDFYPHPAAPALIVGGRTTGRVTVAAWGVVEGKPKKLADLVIQVGEGDPEPTPVPVPPADAFAADLKAAFAGTPREDRGAVPKLASVYAFGATEAATAATWSDLFLAMEAKAKADEVSGHVPLVQAVVQKLLVAELPSAGAGPKALTAADRTKAAAVFRRVQVALAALGQ